jgi:hypothetical protein
MATVVLPLHSRLQVHLSSDDDSDFLVAQPLNDSPQAAPAPAYDSSWTNIPCAGNILWTPMDFFSTIYAWMHAKAIGDEEGAFDAGLRLAGMPLSIVHAICASFTYLLQIGYVFHDSIAEFLEPISQFVGFPALVLGSVLCVIEGIYESICLGRAVYLIKQMRTGLLTSIDQLLALDDPQDFNTALTRFLAENADARAIYETFGDMPDRKAQLVRLKDELLIENLSYFEAEYLTLKPEETTKIREVVRQNIHNASPGNMGRRERELEANLLAVKRTSLDRRVRPWCGQRICQELRPFLDTLRSPESSVEELQEAREGAQNLLQAIDIQAKKKMIIHIVGLIALTASAIGFILTMVACPVLIPFILITIGGTLSTWSYLGGRGSLDHEGWTFSICDAIIPIGWLYNLYKRYTASQIDSEGIELADVPDDDELP